jgi:hypothetical protein
VAQAEGHWEPTPWGVVWAVLDVTEATDPRFRSMCVVTLGDEAMELLTGPNLHGAGDDPEAVKDTIRRLVTGFDRVQVGWLTHDDRVRDLVIVVCVAGDGETHTTVLRQVPHISP